jgi:hypothetical protein
MSKRFKNKSKINRLTPEQEVKRKSLSQQVYGFILLSLVPFCLAGWFGFLYFGELANSSANWSQIEGKIIQSYGHYSSGYKSGRILHANIVYEYSKDNKVYRSNTISFGAFKQVGSDARMYLERYPLNQRVTVYYDPRNPQNSCLEPSSFDSRFHIHLIFALVLFFFGCGLANKGLSIFQRLETNPRWTG